MYFIDRSLATFNAAQKPLYVEGHSGSRSPGQTPGEVHDGVRLVAAAQQDDILRHREDAVLPVLRFDTIVGMFALPSYGGNRDYARLAHARSDAPAAFQAPFGYYDADANRED